MAERPFCKRRFIAQRRFAALFRINIYIITDASVFRHLILRTAPFRIVQFRFSFLIGEFFVAIRPPIRYNVNT
jgi:hypothetical protein